MTPSPAAVQKVTLVKEILDDGQIANWKIASVEDNKKYAGKAYRVVMGFIVLGFKQLLVF